MCDKMILIDFPGSHMVPQGANAGVNALEALAEVGIVCKYPEPNRRIGYTFNL